MKDLQLAGGDLFAAGRGLAMVAGPDYLRQRVATALAEPYGSDPYHPEWGSGLDAYLGVPAGPDTTALIRAEVGRVLDQLIAAQRQILITAAMQNVRSRLSAGDIIASVDKVDAQPGLQFGTMQVAVTLTTEGHQQISLSRTVGA